MHYKNGREAKNGDLVVQFPIGNPNTPRVGILYDAVAGNDLCNGRLAEQRATDTYANLSECLHLDDVKAALGDLSKVTDATKLAAAIAAAHTPLK